MHLPLNALIVFHVKFEYTCSNFEKKKTEKVNLSVCNGACCLVLFVCFFFYKIKRDSTYAPLRTRGGAQWDKFM